MNNTITTTIKKITLLVSFLLILSHVGFSQQTNNWYFGSAGCNANTGMRLNFTAGNTFLTTGYPLMTEEGSSSISDASGNPLFYTDGTDAWDATTNVKFNTFSLGGGSSSSQSSIVLPKPGTTNEWFVFTVDVNGVNGAGYVTVRKTGSVFSVVEPAKVSLVGAGIIGEGLCIIGSTKANSDSWVIVRDRGTTGQIRAFEVTSAGTVVTTPVLSTMSGPGFTNTNYDQLIGIIKSNTCQNRLAFTYFNNDADLVAFNPATGQLRANTAKRILNPAGLGLGHSYGVEFSPNDKYLYLTALNEGKVFQYDTAVATRRAVEMVDIADEAGQLQLAPDGKIYMARMGGNCPAASYLATINNPDLAGATFTANAVNLTSVTNGSGQIGGSYRGLPTFTKSLIANSLFAQPASGNYCINTDIPLSYTFGGYVASTLWRISPGTAGVDWSYIVGSSTSVAPTVRFTVAGTYRVIAEITDNCNEIYRDTMFYTISAPKVPAGTISCNPTSLTFTATGAVAADYPNYVWYDAATGGSVLAVGSPATVNYPSMAAAPTSVWVEVAASATVGSSGSNTIGPTIPELNYSGGLTSGTQSLSVLAGSVTLNSFQVLTRAGASYGGNFTVSITNSASATVFSQVYNVTGTAGGTTYTVNLNKILGTGTYTISISGAAQWMMKSTGTLTYSNAGQLALGSSAPYPILTNLQYDYTNFSIVSTCSQRVRVDRKCLIILPGDGTYCTNTDIPMSYTFEGTAVSQTWSVSGTAGVDWQFVAPSTSASAAPNIRFLNTGNYTITLSVTDNTSTVFTKTQTFNIIPGTNPNGAITCGATSMTLTATGTPSSDYPNYVWYSAATGGSVLGIGTPVTLNYSIPSAAPASVWVEVANSASVSSSGSGSIGPAANTTDLNYSGGLTGATQALSVTASSVTLTSFQVITRAGTTYGGAFTVTITDAASATVFSQSYNVTGTAGGTTYTVNLGTTLGTGNYTIAISGAAQWMMKSGAPLTYSNAQLALGTASPWPMIANLQYTYANYSITPKTCINRVRVDRLCSLPVELISFTGKNTSAGNVLNWVTTSEINNDYFELQRSTDGVNFVTIGTIDGKGNSTMVSEYQFIDAGAASGINYYRLVQTDFNGQQSTSSVVKIYTGFTNASSFVISPNPSTESFAIRFLDLDGGEISVLDVLGKVLISKGIESGTERIEIGADFAKGAYVVRFSGANGISSQLIIKE